MMIMTDFINVTPEKKSVKDFKSECALKLKNSPSKSCSMHIET